MGKLSLGQGSGGRLTGELVRRFLERFEGASLQESLEDCTMITRDMAVTIDGFTVSPRVFPGGDIGKLSICGGTNDLAVRGIKPLFVALSLIAEEGFEEAELLSHLDSAASVCRELGVKLAAGDTKVAPKGSLEGLFMTVASVGKAISKPLGMDRINPGDAIALTGDLGRHGAVIASLRFGLKTEGLLSDCAPLWPVLEPLVRLDLLKASRDCTRGGLATVLCEWAEGTGLGFEIEEKSLPITEGVNSICDILGFDPLHLASEGCGVLAFAPENQDKVMELLPGGKIIGKAVKSHGGLVAMRTFSGGMRVIDMPVGEILPRIC